MYVDKTMAKFTALLAIPFVLFACNQEVEVQLQEDVSGQPVKELYMTAMDPATLCSDISVPTGDGGTVQGARDCGIPEVTCEDTGDVDCYLDDASLYGLSPDDLDPANIRTGVTIAEVTGTAIPDEVKCVQTGDQSCVAAEPYVSVTSTAVTAKVAVDQTIANLQGSFVPDLPEASHVLATAQTGDAQGQLPACTAAVTSACVLGITHKAVPVAALVAGDIRDTIVIGGVTGTFTTGAPTCAAGNVVGCVTTSRFAAVDKTRVLATNLLDNYDVNGIVGTVLAQHAPCTGDNQTACLATAPYKAIQKSKVTAGIVRSGVTIAGVTGDYPSASHPLPNADGGIDDLTSITFNSRMASGDSFELWDATGTRHVLQGDADLAANRIADGVAIFGVTGNLSARPADCASDGEDDCVTVAAYPAIEVSTVQPGNLRKDVTIAGITGIYPSAAARLAVDTPMADLNLPTHLASASQVEFFDSTGARQVVQGTTDFTANNILTGVTLFGVDGSAVARPVDCNGHDGVGCVADASYPAYKKADLTEAVVKKGVTIGTVTGIFPSGVPGSRLAGSSATADLTADNFANNVANTSNVEFWDSAGNHHIVSGDSDLAAANILSGVTIFGIAGTMTVQPASCGPATRDCLTTLTHPSYDASVVTAAVIKNGVTIGEVTGGYPSNTHKFGDSTNMTELVGANFNDLMAGGTTFEYWDSAGNRFTAVGDSDLVASNIRKDTGIFGVLGTTEALSSDCSTDNEEDCVTTAAFPAYKKARLTAPVIKNGTTILGVTGTYPSVGNSLGSATITKDLNATDFDSYMADSESFEYWTSTGVRQTSAGDDDLIPANLTQGTTVHGVAGTIAPTPGNCTASNGTACVATATYPAIDKSEVTEGILKNGVTRLGVTGQYPSANYPLAGADNTLDLTSDTFTAKMQSASAFEYFDAEGNRYTSTGDADLQPTNIQSGQTLLGVAGSFVGVDADIVWDMAHGTSLNGAAGRVKTNCRNLADTTHFAGDGGNYASIDDTNYYDQMQFPEDNTWGTAEAACGAAVFKDVSIDASGDPTACVSDSTTVHCMVKDRIAGITWHEVSDGDTKKNWNDAKTFCDNLTTGGHNDWRLPTMKEAMAANVHGINRVKVAVNIPGNEDGQTYRTNFQIWTSTADSKDPNNKVISLNMALAKFEKQTKATLLYSHCVR